jgi:hypothetical protein
MFYVANGLMALMIRCPSFSFSSMSNLQHVTPLIKTRTGAATGVTVRFFVFGVNVVSLTGER